MSNRWKTRKTAWAWAWFGIRDGRRNGGGWRTCLPMTYTNGLIRDALSGLRTIWSRLRLTPDNIRTVERIDRSETGKLRTLAGF